MTHLNFEKEHDCNVFCNFFEVPTTYTNVQSEMENSPAVDSDPVRQILIL